MSATDNVMGSGVIAARGSEIEELLPHRPPFLFVDYVEVEGAAIRGERRFTASDFFFAGHFPGFPVVPGVILIETLAQCGGVGVKLQGVKAAGTFLLAKVKEARFRRPVRPGELFIMEVENIRASSSIVHQRGRGFVESELAIEAEWLCIVGASAAAATPEGRQAERAAALSEIGGEMARAGASRGASRGAAHSNKESTP